MLHKESTAAINSHRENLSALPADRVALESLQRIKETKQRDEREHPGGQPEFGNREPSEVGYRGRTAGAKPRHYGVAVHERKRDHAERQGDLAEQEYLIEGGEVERPTAKNEICIDHPGQQHQSDRDVTDRGKRISAAQRPTPQFGLVEHVQA